MNFPIFADLYDKDENVLVTVNLCKVDVIDIRPDDTCDMFGGKSHVKVYVTIGDGTNAGYILQSKLNLIKYIFGVDYQANLASEMRKSFAYASDILFGIKHNDHKD